jgi:hypothetical protein
MDREIGTAGLGRSAGAAGLVLAQGGEGAVHGADDLGNVGGRDLVLADVGRDHIGGDRQHVDVGHPVFGFVRRHGHGPPYARPTETGRVRPVTRAYGFGSRKTLPRIDRAAQAAKEGAALGKDDSP